MTRRRYECLMNKFAAIGCRRSCRVFPGWGSGSTPRTHPVPDLPLSPPDGDAIGQPERPSPIHHGNGYANVSLTIVFTETEVDIRWVFVTTVAGTLAAASAVAAQTSSAPPAAAPAAPSAAPSAPATGAPALAQRLERPRQVASLDALAVNQQHSITKQRRPLSAHPRLSPIRRRAQRHPMLPRRGECPQAGLRGAGTVDGATKGRRERPKSSRE